MYLGTYLLQACTKVRIDLPGRFARLERPVSHAGLR